VVLSLLTRQKKTDEDLRGLVYSLTPRLIEENVVWYQRPVGLAVIVGVVCVILSIIFW
jgi:SSS family solute:Na+ symporter